MNYLCLKRLCLLRDVTAHKRSIIFFHAVQEDVVNSQMDQMMQQLKGIVSQKNAQSIAQMVDQTVQFLATIDAQRSELASFGKYGLSSNDIVDIQGKYKPFFMQLIIRLNYHLI